LLITTTSLIAGVTLAQLKIEPYTPLSQHALTDESALDPEREQNTTNSYPFSHTCPHKALSIGPDSGRLRA
jgi:hypothetical protein